MAKAVAKAVRSAQAPAVAMRRDPSGPGAGLSVSDAEMSAADAAAATWPPMRQPPPLRPDAGVQVFFDRRVL